MSLEATALDDRGSSVADLADRLGLSQNQLIDEAIDLFATAVNEVIRGRRLVALDPSTESPANEISTPTLAVLEWTQNPQKLDLSPKAIAKMQELIESPEPPNEALTAAFRHHCK